MITTVNREYCKKILICLPGQSHPEQYHRIKEETFNVMHGDLTLTLDDKQILPGVGEVITIRPGQKHHFFSKEGAVLEEISTTHLRDDSIIRTKISWRTGTASQW